MEHLSVPGSYILTASVVDGAINCVTVPSKVFRIAVSAPKFFVHKSIPGGAFALCVHPGRCTGARCSLLAAALKEPDGGAVLRPRQPAAALSVFATQDVPGAAAKGASGGAAAPRQGVAWPEDMLSGKRYTIQWSLWDNAVTGQARHAISWVFTCSQHVLTLVL